jgi:4F5 protein related disordered region
MTRKFITIKSRSISLMLIPHSFLFFSGGNQRDLARAKNAKKQADASKGKRDDGLSVAQRKQRDADAMRAKQEVC